MQCICACFTPPSPVIRIDLPVNPHGVILCRICTKPVEQQGMSCQRCNALIGHPICVEQWMVRRGHCPNCYQSIV